MSTPLDPNANAPKFRFINDPVYGIYRGHRKDELRGREVVGEGFRFLILEAKQPVATGDMIALAIDAYGAFRILYLWVDYPEDSTNVTFRVSTVDNVFRHSIFDALADYAEATA